MGQPVRSVTDYLSALLQEQIDAWRDELTKSTSAQAKANRDAESNRKKSGIGAQKRSEKDDVSGAPLPDGSDHN